jgi:two-component system, sensor histidine kinase RegB
MHENLKYLLLIRMIAISGQVVALVFMHSFLAIELPLLLIVSIITTLGLFTLLSWLYLQKVQLISEPVFILQLIVDLVALTLLVYYTGGSANPFIFLFILPIIFAAASMRTGITAFLTIAAISCYTFLMFFHVPISSHHAQHSGVELHIWGMWYGFVLSAVLVGYFVSRIARTLRLRDLDLSKAREEALRNEQVVTLGTLAAGTAHELGTPLSTMAVLTRELELQYDELPELAEDLRLVRSQIDRCKGILEKMASDAGQLQAVSGHVLRIDHFLEEIAQEWHQLRSDIQFRVNWHGVKPEPHIIADRTLSHAVINILNNAANASSRSVEIEGEWTLDSLTISVRDDGRGLPANTKEKIGQEILSGETEGLGIGLFLAQTTLNRLGGRLEISNLQVGGVLAKIDLPLGSILATKTDVAR